MEEKKTDPPTFSFVSLGCAKNLVDSERMLGLLATEGYVPVSDPRGADMVIVNTCGFIESSRQESRAVIDEMLEMKAKGDVKGVIVTGCLAERQGQQIITEIPQVDAAVGVFGREEIAAVAERFMNGAVEQRTIFRPAAVKALDDTARLRVTPRHFAYMKISEGCDRTCTFCAIPGMRGKHVTKPIEQVVAEAKELASDDVRELIIVSQDTTYYGKDFYGEVRLAELLRQVDQVEGLEWIRILYAYPEHIDDELIETLASAKRIIPYLDMPLQHINSRVLKRMQRRHSREQTIDILGRLREKWPNLTLRTTFIVGFPGETEEEFQELVDFVSDFGFDRVGVFTYSYEEGTPATKLDGHLPEEVKEERRQRLMVAQQQVAFEKARTKIGREMTVIIDDVDRRSGRLIARSEGDAPEIDTVVNVVGGKAKPGQFLKVRVTNADGYDVTAEAVGEPW
ncbi:Ribosomal protein S12 methylthiotransferase RimO [Planctomycetes bacterium Pan216]|uniref:Ribosomal protein uS12 methylthiotransferase RimO n=1 Tax=Kolteria novifilia TaxID=2527975 RepID=A0A518AXY6_9BACT|nr:Ribosomal protein S12 methylthiotransferase RimO [Planctomycetes bacterium Pan216]